MYITPMNGAFSVPEDGTEWFFVHLWPGEPSGTITVFGPGGRKMNNELLATLEYIEQERGISKEQLVEAVEKAIQNASRKSIHPAKELFVKLDRATGELRAWAKLEVVESFPNNDQLLLKDAQKVFPDVQIGEILDWEVTPKNFGRIAAQTARQAILQQLRKAEKEIAKDEYSDKVGEIMSGTVKRIDAGAIIVDLQKSEGILAGKDKVPGEQYMVGERINALLVKVDADNSGPSLILSRANGTFVKKLFEREISEIHDGTVEIVSVARDPGMRTKIAVRSNDPRVDPVGACVGMRGMRVKNITGELGSERVDIIRYEEDICDYVTNALHPAKLGEIRVDEENTTLYIHLKNEDSRLAFGKKAQNVRLAQKLVGYAIKFIIDDAEDTPAETFEEKKERVAKELAEALGIGEEPARILVNNGYLTVEGLRVAGIQDIAAIKGLDDTSIVAISKAIGNTEGE